MKSYDHPSYDAHWTWQDNRNPDYLHTTKENPVMITPGELRGRLQPTILLRMTSSVHAAPGNTDTDQKVFGPGVVVFAQYIGNGRLVLTPVARNGVYAPAVVMASALNTTAEIITEDDLRKAFYPQTRNGHNFVPFHSGTATYPAVHNGHEPEASHNDDPADVVGA